MIKKDRRPKVTIRGVYYGTNRTLPSLNDYLAEIGKNPKAGGKMKSDFEKVCVSSIRRCLKGWKVTKPPVQLTYRFFENKKGKGRDLGNIEGFCKKVFEDALQATGVIENDNMKWIDSYITEGYVIDDEPYIEIEFLEKG